MACSSISNLADQIWNDLGQPSDLAISTIQTKLISPSYIGKLNNLVNLCYSGVSGDFSPSLGDNEAAIYRSLYLVDYYATKLNQTLAGYNTSFTRLSEGDSTIVKSSTSEVAKVYKDTRKQLNDELQYLVAAYRLNPMQPLSVEYVSYFNGPLPS